MSRALSTESKVVRADPSTIQDKFLVGYQGWFTCHGDGEPVGPGHHGWLHWFTYPVPDGGNINTDYWPDMSMYSKDELFPAPGFKHLNGEQAYLFSSRNPLTVQKHFKWMAENSVDGAFLQRFVGQCDLKAGNHGIRRIRDEVGELVQQACEKEGRVYAIMYDVAGVKPDVLQSIIEEDWHHLVHDKHILDSPNYLRENGKPVIAVWGLGFSSENHSPELVRSIADFLRRATPGGAYLMAGTPTHWRNSDQDATPNKAFVPAYMESFDAISPWTVGRYSDERSIDHYGEHVLKTDMEFVQWWEREKGRHVDFIPVVHPGGSGHNMSQGQWGINGAPRTGGRFLWRQMHNARKHGARIIYGAMWDEYDEGTQFLPAFSQQHQLPHDDQNKFKFISLDVDGHVLPSDWYMRIAGYGAEALKGQHEIGEMFPEKELKEWSWSHPKMQKENSSSAGAGSSSGQSYAQWSKAAGQAKDGEEIPPPPYSLEADGGKGVQTIPSHGPPTPAATRPQPPNVPQSSRPTSVSLADNMNRLSISSHPSQTASSPRPISPSSHPAASSYAGQTTPSPHPPSLAPRPSISSYPGQRPPSSGPPASPTASSYPGQGPPSPHPPPSPHRAAHPPTQPGFTIPVPDFAPQAPYAAAQQTWPPQQWGAPAPHHYLPQGGPGTYSYPGAYQVSAPGGFMSMPSVDMPGAQGGGYGGYEPSYASFPQPMPSSPTGSSPPPPVPARPTSAQPPPPPPQRTNYPPPSSTPPSSSSGSYSGFVDRVAGEERRKKLESGVGGLASRGSKLFGRFTGNR